MINLETKTSYHVFDEHGMLCIPSDQSWEKRSWWKKLWDLILKRIWIPTWSNKSWRDSIGRTVLAWIAYGNNRLLIGLRDCLITNVFKNEWILYRHPNEAEHASRDHWSYFIIINLMVAKTPEHFASFIKKVPRMRGLNSWMKALTGNKRAEFWYYTLAIPGAMLGNWWLRKCRKWGRISPELSNLAWISIRDNPQTFGTWMQQTRTTWQKLWAWIIGKIIPAYSLHNKAWQIYVMPKSPKRDTLRKILLKRVGQSNLMLRLLFQSGIAVTQEEVDNYPHLTGYRPGVYLDETCRRDIREMTPEESAYNSYEHDLVLWLWNNR